MAIRGSIILNCACAMTSFFRRTENLPYTRQTRDTLGTRRVTEVYKVVDKHRLSWPDQQANKVYFERIQEVPGSDDEVLSDLVSSMGHELMGCGA